MPKELEKTAYVQERNKEKGFGRHLVQVIGLDGSKMLRLYCRRMAKGRAQTVG